jgi:hypothetical protein
MSSTRITTTLGFGGAAGAIPPTAAARQASGKVNIRMTGSSE